MPRPLRYTLHPGLFDSPARSIDTPDRHGWAIDVLDALGAERVIERRSATLPELCRAHHPDYVQGLRALSAAGAPVNLDPELTVDERTFVTASAAAGALIAETERALADPGPVRLCLSRPGSHHASADFAMGFCVINHLAVAARHAVHQLDLARVAILDFDVHHGNGSQSIFYCDEQVMTVSMHQWPFFPGTGSADELGDGPGQGRNLNLPLSAGSDGQSVAVLWQQGLDAVAAFEPQLVLFEAGFDAHSADWTSDVHMTDADFCELGLRTARTLSSIGCPAVFELGGGYTQPAVTGGLHAFLSALTGRSEQPS